MRRRTLRGGNIPAQYLVYNAIHLVARGLHFVASDLSLPTAARLEGRADARLAGRAPHAAVRAQGEALAVCVEAADTSKAGSASDALGAHVGARGENNITSNHRGVCSRI